MLRGLLVLVSLGLTLYALFDCLRADQRQLQGLPRWLWSLVIVVVPVAGPLGWLLTKGRARPVAGPPARRGPVAPDDDPAFLRELERLRKEREAEEQLRRWEEELGRGEGTDRGPDPERGPDDPGSAPGSEGTDGTGGPDNRP